MPNAPKMLAFDHPRMFAHRGTPYARPPGHGLLPLHALQMIPQPQRTRPICALCYPSPRQQAARSSPFSAIVFHSEIMNTAFLLIAMYSGRPIIPAEDVARDFFGLSTDKFIRKVSAGSIALPLVRMEASQKCAKGVHIDDLADYLDKRRAAAVKECLQLQGLR